MPTPPTESETPDAAAPADFPSSPELEAMFRRVVFFGFAGALVLLLCAMLPNAVAPGAVSPASAHPALARVGGVAVQSRALDGRGRCDRWSPALPGSGPLGLGAR